MSHDCNCCRSSLQSKECKIYKYYIWHSSECVMGTYFAHVQNSFFNSSREFPSRYVWANGKILVFKLWVSKWSYVCVDMASGSLTTSQQCADEGQPHTAFVKQGSRLRKITVPRCLVPLKSFVEVGFHFEALGTRKIWTYWSSMLCYSMHVTHV